MTKPRPLTAGDLPGLPQSLEDLVCGEAYGSISSGMNQASPRQRGILRVADGRPHGLHYDESHQLFGEGAPTRGNRPDTVVIVGGRGGGKSIMSAGACVWGALVADLEAGHAGSAVGPGDETRSVVLAPTADLAGQTFSFAKAFFAPPSPLAALVVGKILKDSFIIQRPSDGRQVEIIISAASSSGTSLRGRWLCTVVLEECAFFGQESKGYSVNAEDLERAAMPRLRHQLWGISSPNGPDGWLYEQWKAGHQQKTAGLVVAQASTQQLNPSYPQSKVDKAVKKDPDAAAREIFAQWTDAEMGLLISAQVDACSTRIGDAPRLPGAEYVATMDPATRGNAWTAAVAVRVATGVVIAGTREWQGSKTKPLDTGIVLDELREFLDGFGLNRCETDQWCSDALISQGREHGVFLAVWPRANEDEWQQAQSLKEALGAGTIELPRDPQVREDLLGAKRVLTPRGAAIKLPVTANGRHCDFFPSIAKAHFRASGRPPWIPAESAAVRLAAELAAEEQREADEQDGKSKWWRR